MEAARPRQRLLGPLLVGRGASAAELEEKKGWGTVGRACDWAGEVDADETGC